MRPAPDVVVLEVEVEAALSKEVLEVLTEGVVAAGVVRDDCQELAERPVHVSKERAGPPAGGKSTHLLGNPIIVKHLDHLLRNVLAAVAPVNLEEVEQEGLGLPDAGDKVDIDAGEYDLVLGSPEIDGNTRFRGVCLPEREGLSAGARGTRSQRT